MADEIDIANDLVANEVSRALNKIRQNNAQVHPGAKECMECGEEIPIKRQQLGYHLCVPCAQEIERRKSLFSE